MHTDILHDTIKQSQSLTMVNLNRNRISDIGASAIKQIQSLATVNLSYNPFRKAIKPRWV